MADNLVVTVADEQLFTTTATLDNPTYVEHVEAIGDVDVTSNGKVDGSILVYKQATNKWTSTTLLNLQQVEAGEF